MIARGSGLAPCSDDAVGTEDPSLRLAQAVRRALAQGPERAELEFGVMNATYISGLAAAGLGARGCELGDALTGINRADSASVKSFGQLEPAAVRSRNWIAARVRGALPGNAPVAQ